MRSISLLLLCLLWSLVEVQSQTAPYITFMGNTLTNHSFIHLQQVGEDNSGIESNSVQCHYGLGSGLQSYHGNWFAPGSDTQLPFPSELGDIYQIRQAEVVHLHRRNNADGPSGIYRCVIGNATNSSLGESVYVGLYFTRRSTTGI